MMTRIIIFIVLTTFAMSCNINGDRHTSENHIKEQLIGEWERISEKTDFNEFFFRPEGMSIYHDSIEFYLGYFKVERDSFTGRRTRLYLGNFSPYKIEKDSIYIISPLAENWGFKWKFICRKNDTLEMAVNDTTILKYKKITYELDTLPDFDQIIYSSSGCYGSCPIIDISVAKDGNVLFQGEGYVNQLGFYSSTIDHKLVAYILNKFRRANPLRLLDEYAVGHTDDQSLTTTYIKDGKIVKTIHDYGMASTNELIWAYIPIANLYNSIQLDSLEMNEPFYPKLHYFTFRKDGLILPLEKSESFYLWTELKKSSLCESNYKPIYRLTFSGNYTYWGPDPNESRQHKYEIKKVTTDGQFFTFEFKNFKSITYDLGYNFIDRNFSISDFRKPLEWED